jgi:hypothetical protein
MEKIIIINNKSAVKKKNDVARDARIDRHSISKVTLREIRIKNYILFNLRTSFFEKKGIFFFEEVPRYEFCKLRHRGPETDQPASPVSRVVKPDDGIDGRLGRA